MEKITRNMKRDEQVSDRLRRDGWNVIRVWESDILDDPSRAADAVLRQLGRT